MEWASSGCVHGLLLTALFLHRRQIAVLQAHIAEALSGIDAGRITPVKQPVQSDSFPSAAYKPSTVWKTTRLLPTLQLLPGRAIARHQFFGIGKIDSVVARTGNSRARGNEYHLFGPLA